MKLAIVLAVIVLPPMLLGWAMLRVAAEVDERMANFDDDDVYCPRCDGTDLFGWGEDSWSACNGCKMLFKQGEPT